MLMDAIGRIAGALTLAVWVAALVVARLGQIGELIGKTPAAFVHA